MKKDSLGAKDFHWLYRGYPGSDFRFPGFRVSGFPGFLSIVQQRSTVNNGQRPTHDAQ